jgi:hypothetical protein
MNPYDIQVKIKNGDIVLIESIGPGDAFYACYNRRDYGNILCSVYDVRSYQGDGYFSCVLDPLFSDRGRLTFFKVKLMKLSS